jgi:AcrR family transcriptional regulator
VRSEIKSLALDLLIRHGYRGVSFGDLADALGMTRANIHYHFGNKQNLVEEVLEDYIRETTDQARVVWCQPGLSLTGRIDAMVEYSRARYLKFNPPGDEGRPWSLIARMRQDADALTPKGRAALQEFGRDLNATIAAAIEEAKAANEFSPSMPVQDVALQLVSIANSAGPITQDARNFDRLEQLYSGFARIITQAFGQQKPDGRRSRPGKPASSADAPAPPARVRRRAGSRQRPPVTQHERS